MGRKKIDIKKIECAIKRRMTLNKRSRGLIKKAKELAILCDADVALVIISAGKVQHFSNRAGIEQIVERFNANIPERSEAGMCANNKEPCKGSCCESHLLESGNQFLSEKQIETGQEENEAPVYSDIMDELPSKLELDNFLESDFTPFSSEQIDNGPLSTNPASGMQSAHFDIPIQQSQMWEVKAQAAQIPGLPLLGQCRPSSEKLAYTCGQLVDGEVQMQGFPIVEIGDPSSMQTPAPLEVRGPKEGSDQMHLSRGLEPSFPLWEQAAGGEIGSNADQAMDTLLQNNWCANELREMSKACCYFLD